MASIVQLMQLINWVMPLIIRMTPSINRSDNWPQPCPIPWPELKNKECHTQIPFCFLISVASAIPFRKMLAKANIFNRKGPGVRLTRIQGTNFMPWTLIARAPALAKLEPRLIPWCQSGTWASSQSPAFIEAWINVLKTCSIAKWFKMAPNCVRTTTRDHSLVLACFQNPLLLHESKDSW